MSPPSIGRVTSFGAPCSRRANCGESGRSDKEALGIQPKADAGERPIFHELAKSNLEPNLAGADCDPTFQGGKPCIRTTES
jgi:hypothetical protein